MTTEARRDAADWRLPAGGGTYRADAAEKSAGRIALEAEAAKHGVAAPDYYSERLIQQLVVEKLAPGVHPDMAAKSDAYVQRAFELALERAAKAAEAAAAEATAAAASPRDNHVNGGGAPRADSAAGPVRSSEELRRRLGVPGPQQRRPVETAPQIRADAAGRGGLRGGAPPVRSSAELRQRLKGGRP